VLDHIVACRAVAVQTKNFVQQLHTYEEVLMKVAGIQLKKLAVE
jgi:hypothetical protein